MAPTTIRRRTTLKPGRPKKTLKKRTSRPKLTTTSAASRTIRKRRTTKRSTIGAKKPIAKRINRSRPKKLATKTNSTMGTSKAKHETKRIKETANLLTVFSTTKFAKRSSHCVKVNPTPTLVKLKTTSKGLQISKNSASSQNRPSFLNCNKN